MKNALILFIFSVAFCTSVLAQTNVGIGNNAPLTKLDVSGALSVREGSPLSTLSAGNNNNVALPVVPSTSDVAGFCRITAPTGGTFTITGIVPNTGANGQIITLINTTGKVMTIANASSSSSAANRIYTQTGASLVDNASATANSGITMQYSQNAGGTGVAGWMVTATQNFSVSNVQLANSGITISNGTGISVSGSPVSLGGTVTVTNTGVTSVGMTMPGIFTVTGSPVTTTGTLTAALASESGNTVLAAPNGSAGTPTFRALVVADIPASGVTAGTYNTVTVNTEGMVTSANNTSYQTPLTAGNGITISSGTISADLWTASSNNIYNANTGNVGIGITTPATTLHVLSANSNGIALDATSGGQGYMLYTGGTSTATGSQRAAMALAGAAGSWSKDALANDVVIRTSGVVTGGTGSPKQKILFNTSGGTGNSTMAINGSNVGIEDTLPIATLDVEGGGSARTGTAPTTPAVYFTGSSAMASGTTGPASGDIEFRHPNQTQGIGFGYQSIYQTGSASNEPLNLLASGTGAITLNAYSYGTGPVCVGTTATTYELNVGGSIGIPSNGGGAGNRLYLAGTDANHYIYSTGTSGNNMYFGEYSNFYFTNTSTGSNVMSIVGSWVGIGTNSPGAPLDVESTESGYTVPNPSYAYGQSGHGPNEGVNGASETISIYAAQNVLGVSFIGFSDARLKNVIGQSSSAEDLEVLRKIKITDYTMRDVIKNGAAPHKKVIAQELKEVYPTAVKTIPTPQFIPNIYCNAENYTINGNEFTINMPRAISDTNIKAGATCKFYVSDTAGREREVKGKVSAFSPTQFRITTADVLKRGDLSDRLFVYGTEVNNLLAVDYDAISMLNVSATQELARKVAALEKQNTALIGANQKLDEQNCDLAQKVDALSSVNNEVQLLHGQMNELKALMEKNGIRAEK